MERLGVRRVDSGDTFLDDVENDDRLGNVRYVETRRRSKVKITYIVRISARVVEPVGPVDQAFWLCAILQKIIVGSLVHGLHLITAESDCFDSPVAILNVEDFGSKGSNDAKVVASPLHRPPQIRVCINLCQGSVGKDDVH